MVYTIELLCFYFLKIASIVNCFQSLKVFLHHFVLENITDFETLTIFTVVLPITNLKIKKHSSVDQFLIFKVILYLLVPFVASRNVIFIWLQQLELNLHIILRFPRINVNIVPTSYSQEEKHGERMIKYYLSFLRKKLISVGSEYNATLYSCSNDIEDSITHLFNPLMTKAVII